METIELIKSQIKTKRASLTKLKEQEQELKHLQAVVADIPRIEADIAALERTMAILKGEEVPAPSRSANLQDSIPNVIYSVLEEAGTPMTLKQLMPLLVLKGYQFAETSVRGALYRSIKARKLFKLIDPGTFGLLEWPK